MKRRAARLAVVVVVPLALALALGTVAGPLLGCSKERALVGAGQDCDLAADCLPGLVCIEEERGGRRVCSNDLTRVQGELPPEGGAPATPAEAGTEGGTPPAPDSGQPVQDSGSNPPPQDAATNG